MKKRVIINLGRVLAGLMAVTMGLAATGGRALAFYNDTESSAGNTFTAASLDFSLDPGADFSPEVTPDLSASREAAVVNDGSLGFVYRVKAENLSGSLCPALNISAALDGENKYNAALSGFDIASFAFSAPEDWNFTASLNDDDGSLRNQTCNFDIRFIGWHASQSEGSGFTDEEVLSATVTSGTWVVDSCLTESGDTISSVLTGSSFGTAGHNLIIASGGELKSPTSGGSDGVITITTDCDVRVQSGGKITAAKGDGTGGAMTVNARNLTVDAGGEISAGATVADKNAGSITATTTADINVNGDLKANGDNKAGGDITFDAGGDVNIAGSSVRADSVYDKGGNILITTDNDLSVTGVLSASGKEDGGEINIVTGNNFNVESGGQVLDESINEHGGTIMAVIGGASTIDGTISGNGEKGNGLMVMTVQGNFNVNTGGLIKFDTTGASDNGGTIGIKVGGTASYAGIVRSNATDDGLNMALWSEGDTTISGTVSANGGGGAGDNGGVLDLTSRGNLTISGTATATGTTNGTVYARAVTLNVTGTVTPAATSQSITLNDIVLNEIIPNPTGNDQGSGALPLDGEWMELYNKSGAPVDVNGWTLRDADGNTLAISAAKGDNNGNLSDAGETIVPAGGMLTVYRNGASGLTLNDDGDTVQLLTNLSVLVDSFTYVVNVGSGNSIARMPDGTGAWVDPEPTPTALNGGLDVDKLRTEFLAKLLARAQAATDVAPEPIIESGLPDGAVSQEDPADIIVEESDQMAESEIPIEEEPAVIDVNEQTPSSNGEITEGDESVVQDETAVEAETFEPADRESVPEASEIADEVITEPEAVDEPLDELAIVGEPAALEEAPVINNNPEETPTE